jgi:DNA-binding NarL/FixJ family response regulator
MKFLVVDDDFGCLRGMAMTLQEAYKDSQVFEARSVAEAIKVLGQEDAIDLVLLDLMLDDSSEIQTLKRLKKWCEDNECNPRIVVVSGAAPWVDTLIAECIDECATGFIEKGASVKKFLLAVEMTLEGGIYITEGYTKGQAAARAKRAGEAESVPLTVREKEVLLLLVKGLTYKQVAKRLQSGGETSTTIAENTVRVHVQRMAWKVKSADGTGDDELSAKAAVLTAFSRKRFKLD